MKIWGNDLKVGDTIYYEYDLDIRQSTVKVKDTKSFKMPSLIMENGDRIFVNDYYYTEKHEVIDNLLKKIQTRCLKKLDEIKKEQELLTFTESIIKDKLKELRKFKVDYIIDEANMYYEDMRIECCECHTVINFHEDEIIDDYYIICPRCGEHLELL